MSAQSKHHPIKIILALLLALVAVGLAIDRAVKVGMIRLPGAGSSSVRETKLVAVQPPPVTAATPPVDTSGAMRQEVLAAPPVVDIDSIYRRIYLPDEFPRTTEAEALRVYGQLNRPDSPGYDEGKLAIRLFALRSTKDDLYGEAWLQIAAGYAQQAHAKGNRDELVKTIFETFNLKNSLIYYGNTQDEYLGDLVKFQSSPYPTVLKMPVLLAALSYLFVYTEFGDDHVLDQVPIFTDMGVVLIAKMVEEKAPPRIIYGYSSALLGLTKFSNGQRDKYEKIIAETLSRAKAPEFIAVGLRGKYLINLAWESRGYGFSNTVTQEGEKRMANYLREAEELLEAASLKYPDIAWFPELLMDVELGQGRGRARMERYFRKATQNAPNDPDPYASKMWYLQPRWYGSEKDVVDFCLECRDSERWSVTIPLVVFKGINDLSFDDPAIYKNPGIRAFVQNTYEEYLRRYPMSLLWRTKFLKHAAAIEDWLPSNNSWRFWISIGTFRSLMMPTMPRSLTTRRSINGSP